MKYIYAPLLISSSLAFLFLGSCKTRGFHESDTTQKEATNSAICPQLIADIKKLKDYSLLPEEAADCDSVEIAKALVERMHVSQETDLLALENLSAKEFSGFSRQNYPLYAKEGPDGRTVLDRTQTIFEIRTAAGNLLCLCPQGFFLISESNPHLDQREAVS